MGVTISALGIDKSSVASRPRLVREIRESIENEVAPPPLSEEIRREIDRRLANHAANPGAAIPWEEVKRSALARAKQ